MPPPPPVPPPVVKERVRSPVLSADPKSPGGTVEYVVLGSDDPAAVQAAVLAVAPQFAVMTVPVSGGAAAGTVERLSVSYQPQGAKVAHVSVGYGVPDAVSLPPPPAPPVPGVPPPPPPPSAQPDSAALGPEYAFDTAGGTEHVTQGEYTRYGTTRGVLPNQEGLAGDTPDYRGALGVGKDKVEGADRLVGKLEWSVTVRRPAVTRAYLRTLAKLTGCVNQQAYFGAGVEELLFLGASGSYRPGEGWAVTYRFAEGATQELVRVPAAGLASDQIAFPYVKPFDHVWFVYEQAEVTVGAAKFLIQRPRLGYCERVQRLGDFSLLGI